MGAGEVGSYMRLLGAADAKAGGCRWVLGVVGTGVVRAWGVRGEGSGSYGWVLGVRGTGAVAAVGSRGLVVGRHQGLRLCRPPCYALVGTWRRP